LEVLGFPAILEVVDLIWSGREDLNLRPPGPENGIRESYCMFSITCGICFSSRKTREFRKRRSSDTAVPVLANGRRLLRQRKRDRRRVAVPALGIAGLWTSSRNPCHVARPGCHLRDELRAPPFSQSEIGLYKSVVLANRLNLFWALDWQGVPERLDPKRRLDGVDILIGCVDTRRGRAAIAKCAEDWSEVDYRWTSATMRTAVNLCWENP
jgi:hypothetical protein